jgi:purine-nucleoside phosphorylase
VSDEPQLARSAALLDEPARALARELEQHGLGSCAALLVLGSGAGGLLERLGHVEARCAGTQLEHLPRARVPGHAGELARVRIGARAVLVQSGRVHRYEGRSPEEVTRCVRAAAALGLRELWLTNAAGALQHAWPVPSLLALSDHIDLQARGPLAAGAAASGSPYSTELSQRVHAAARASGLGALLRSGVYAGVLGPQYESAAECRMLAWMGADAVGMSSVAEAQVGAALGLRVCGLSVLTNAAGGGERALTHAQVLASARAMEPQLAALLGRALAEPA